MLYVVLPAAEAAATRTVACCCVEATNSACRCPHLLLPTAAAGIHRRRLPLPASFVMMTTATTGGTPLAPPALAVARLPQPASQAPI
jgi:hypothetical protein